MKGLPTIVILVVASYSGHSQTFLNHLDSLTPQYTFYLLQKDKISLTNMGSLERQFPSVIFSKAEFHRNSGQLNLEGFINITGDPKDTFSGLSGFDVLLAKKVNGKLSKIRRFGTTGMPPVIDSLNSHEEYFSLKAEIHKDDVLIIGNPGTLCWGAVVLPVGKVLPKRRYAQQRFAKIQADTYVLI